MKNKLIKKIPIELLRAELAPQKASAWSAAYDLRASKEYFLRPGETLLISTGLKLALPEGYEAQVRPRSGLSLRSRLRIANSPGTIDADYRDEVRIILHNAFSQAEIGLLFAENNPLCERFGPIAKEISLYEYLTERGLKGGPEANKPNAALPPSLLGQSVYLDKDGYPWGTEHILAGERLAQLLIVPLLSCEFEEVDDVSRFGLNRGGGFGHSGRL